jgi:predicted nucleotidyltransferase
MLNNMPAIQMNKVDWKILQQILNKHPYTFYAYGSRVKGNARKYSDLDICYYDVPDLVIGDIYEELENSDLPFIVELVAWKNMRPAFQKMIKKDLVLICSAER